MLGLMMQRPLLVSMAIDHAAEVHGDAGLVSVTTEGPIQRTSYRQARRRAARLAHALREDLGIRPGDRVATLAWNGYRHFELYYAVSGIGAVCHTINPRLFPDQLAYIVNHARDRVLFFDTTFAPLVAGLRPRLPADLKLVVMTDRAHLPDVAGLDGLLVHEELMVGKPDDIVWPDLDENTACGLCYTSGTTGEPKGALYSHRSTMLHALFACTTGPSGLRQGYKLLAVVPLFHVNAWGLPYLGPMMGVDLVLPGAKLDGASLFDLIDREEIYSGWGVPTVWLGLLAEMRARGRAPRGLAEVISGGAAAPRPLIEAFERDFGIEVVHGWGMTEMSPIGTIGCLTPQQAALPLDQRIDLKERQGRRMFGVELKIVDADGHRLPHDGVATGELYVRGSAVISGYFENPEASRACFDAEGWFATGDVAKITPDSYLIVVDRIKDLVKSGGEWISSLDVESAAMAHPGVAQCAVIGVPHPKWNERPLLIVVPAPGAAPTRDDILATLAGRLAKWQVPDDVVFVDKLPMTATNKISKLTLRREFQDYRLPEVAP